MVDWIYHDSHNLNYRKPFGAVPCGEKITLEVDVKSEKPADSVFLRLWKGYEEKIEMNLVKREREKNTYTVEILAPETPGLLWYFFIISLDGKYYYYGNNDFNYGGIGIIREYEPPSYQITVYQKNAQTPNWFKESVMYQIFVDRFYNGYDNGKILNKKKNKYLYHYRNWEEDVPLYNRHPQTGEILGYDIYGGNLLGIIKKLPYLKSLGISVIYLNPVFESPSNHKYDTGDYKKIDPMFGDNEVFQQLCKRAKELNIKIILDGVFSHTGSDSIYFNKDGNYPSLGAYQSKESPYYPWYRFTMFPDVYECWWGIDTLPNVNEMEPSYKNFIIHAEDSVIKYWLKMGARGWRLDVVDELPDEFVKDLRKEMKKIDPDSVLIGEVWEDASRKISYGKMREYFLGDELDSVMNYPFRNILLDFILGRKDAEEINNSLMSLFENYPKHNFYSCMNLLGSHDVPRILTLLGDTPDVESLSKEEQAFYKLSEEQKNLAVKRLKLASLIQMTFPGVPCIYYGDEAGMEGFKDPLNRGPYPWGKENMELLNWYKKIINLRNHYDCLKTGEWIPVYASGDVYGYIRKIKNGKDVFSQDKNDNVIVLLFNRNPKDKVTISFDLSKHCSNTLQNVFSKDEVYFLDNGNLYVELDPLEGKVLLENISN